MSAVKKFLKIFFIVFLFLVSISGKLLANEIENFSATKTFTIEAQKTNGEIFNTRKENAHFTTSQNKKIQISNKTSPYHPFLASENNFSLNKNKISYRFCGFSQLFPSKSTPNANNIRAP